ncbi:MAG: radical SAM protein [Actinomycetota bacterium]|nr:radical SAM protein [Actinomycetota bacterium]
MRQIKTTQSVCFECGRAVPALLFESDGKVFMQKECPLHGQRTGLVSGDADWYHRTMSFASPATAPKERMTTQVDGCPLDCGFCTAHQQRMYLPVVSITSACNLDCPVCYTLNRRQDSFFMAKDEFARILEVIHRHDPNMQIINFTGGEPTLHPQFCELVEMCRQAGIHRITVSTNGLRLREDPELLSRLAELEARIVLSFNSFHEQPYRVSAGRNLLDEKLEILRLLDEHKLTTTLLTVVMAGVNDTEIGEIVRYVLESDFIVSSQIHTVTYTGQARTVFDRSTRLTTPDIIAAIAADNREIAQEDFMPSPCAHPLCYSQCYLLKLDAGQTVPLRRFLSSERMWHLLEGSFYMEPTLQTEEILGDAVNEMWGRADPTKLDHQVLAALRRLLRALYPSAPISYQARQKIAEHQIKTIYISSHMDDENFDLERIASCCVSVPAADGRLIPTCAYNNIYRQRDTRFHTAH